MGTVRGAIQVSLVVALSACGGAVDSTTVFVDDAGGEAATADSAAHADDAGIACASDASLKNSDASVICLAEPIRWRSDANNIVDESSIAGCGEYTHSRTSSGAGALTCAQRLEDCTFSASWLAQASALLAVADVEAAFVRGGSFGYQRSLLVTIEVGAKSVSVGTPCDGGLDCVAGSDDLEQLRDVLLAIDSHQTALGECGQVFNAH